MLFRELISYFLLASLIGFLGGCNAMSAKNASLYPETGRDQNREIEDQRVELAELLREARLGRLARMKRSTRPLTPPGDFSNPFTSNLEPTSEVRYFINFYTGKGRRFITEALQRRKQYLPVIDSIFLGLDLPLELSNIAFIESGFKTDARSPMGAVGMWQFMKPTAEYYGLRISGLRDDRKNVERSTIAAARYLMDLYDFFDDWYLSIAAYNGGMSTINRAISQAGSRDFFELARIGGLSQETKDFVPKVLAVAEICKNPKKYGFKEFKL